MHAAYPMALHPPPLRIVVAVVNDHVLLFIRMGDGALRFRPVLSRPSLMSEDASPACNQVAAAERK